jgi:hypothetical protein
MWSREGDVTDGIAAGESTTAFRARVYDYPLRVRTNARKMVDRATREEGPFLYDDESGSRP